MLNKCIEIKIQIIKFVLKSFQIFSKKKFQHIISKSTNVKASDFLVISVPHFWCSLISSCCLICWNFSYLNLNSIFIWIFIFVQLFHTNLFQLTHCKYFLRKTLDYRCFRFFIIHIIFLQVKTQYKIKKILHFVAVN